MILKREWGQPSFSIYKYKYQWVFDILNHYIIIINTLLFKSSIHVDPMNKRGWVDANGWISVCLFVIFLLSLFFTSFIVHIWVMKLDKMRHGATFDSIRILKLIVPRHGRFWEIDRILCTLPLRMDEWIEMNVWIEYAMHKLLFYINRASQKKRKKNE